ncbi:MAG: LuxR C-terminal-related transcriptional regulator, partial [Gaiellaceae bacterium]
ARLELESARALAPRLTRALPWYSVQVALELAQVHLSLLDVSGARSWLADADAILRRRPALGALVARRAELGAQVDRVARAQEGRASTLTAAELRLLPLLATHLSFREIGEHLYVSRNTVKTQAISVYRKLGVSCRSKAIARAGELGLVDRGAQAQVDFIRTA